MEDDVFCLHREYLAGVTVTDLKWALRKSAAESNISQLFVGLGAVESFDPEYASVMPMHLDVEDDNSIVLTLSIFTADYINDDKDLEEKYKSILADLVLRQRAVFLSAAYDLYYAAEPWLVRVRVRPTVRGRTVEEILTDGEALIALADAAESGELTLETALDLLRSSHAEALIGQPEGAWLDVKSQEYDLKTLHGRVDLARAVARFANAERGGLVVIGMRARKGPGGEIVSGLAPISLRPGMVRHYSQVIRDHLYPPPDFLEIELATAGDGVMVLISIPPQPEEHKPFLVHGAVVDGRSEGAFISIVRRRGEESVPITAPAIHATLAAGRALLRRGQISDASSEEGV